jgi:hypothetical protein
MLTTSALSALCGLYSTIVFSLCVLYGKTALGMRKDDMFEYFTKTTGKQRIRGFQAFSMSLQCFAGAVALTIVDDMGWPAAIAAGAAFFVIYDDLHSIIRAAGPIFTGVIPKEEPKKEETTCIKLKKLPVKLLQSTVKAAGPIVSGIIPKESKRKEEAEKTKSLMGNSWGTSIFDQYYVKSKSG